MKVGDCTFALLTDSCCPQVRHPRLHTDLPLGRMKYSLEEGGRVVSGNFGVILTLGSRVLASRGVGRRDRWLGLFLRGVRATRFGGGGASGLHWPEREHPVGSSLLLPRRGFSG